MSDTPACTRAAIPRRADRRVEPQCGNFQPCRKTPSLPNVTQARSLCPAASLAIDNPTMMPGPVDAEGPWRLPERWRASPCRADADTDFHDRPLKIDIEVRKRNCFRARRAVAREREMLVIELHAWLRDCCATAFTEDEQARVPSLCLGRDTILVASNEAARLGEALPPRFPAGL